MRKDKIWMIAYPHQGEWFHVTTLLQTGEICQYAEEHLVSHDMVVLTICGNDMRRWVLNAPQRIKAFYWYLKNNVGSDRLRLRFKVKEKP